MYPAQCDIQLYRGDYFEMTLRLREGTITGTTYTPGDYLDLTGWVPLAQIRANQDSTTILASFTAEILDQVAVKGGVHLFLPGESTAALSVATAVWDVQLTDANVPPRPHTYLRGTVSIEKDVTR